MTSMLPAASTLASICLLVVPPLAWSQGGNPPASAKEGGRSSAGQTAVEQSTPVTEHANKVPRIGFILPGSGGPLETFRRALAEVGYVDGQNIVIEMRKAEGQYERIPELAAELVRLKVDVLAVQGAVTVRGAKKVVTNLPIVFAVVVDPVVEELVANRDRPGGNITGVTTYDPQQARKELELLKEVVPNLKRVAILGDRGIHESVMIATEEAARAMGLHSERAWVAAPTPDLEGAFESFRQEHADALVVLEEPLLGMHAKEIAELARKDRLPAMFAPSSADVGGLIAYGPSLREGYRAMAAFVDKALKGAKPGDLPVKTVNQYEMIVNLKTAREIGVTIPPDVLKRADRVIE